MERSEEVKYLQSLANDKFDPQLGEEVEQVLEALNLNWRFNHGSSTTKVVYDRDVQAAMEALVEGIHIGLSHLGMPMDHDPSLRDTPKRFAKMLVGDLTWGLNYDMFPKCTVVPNSQRYDQMVLVRSIRTISLCEHHLQTISGVTHIAYIPKDNVLGLSKFARITEFFARRPQIQERMTQQIHATLRHVLDTEDVAVVQDCEHYCMKARGAMQPGASTQTDAISGRFRENEALRNEFLSAMKG